MTKVEYLEMRIWEMKQWLEAAQYPLNKDIYVQRSITYSLIEKYEAELIKFNIRIS